MYPSTAVNLRAERPRGLRTGSPAGAACRRSKDCHGESNPIAPTSTLVSSSQSAYNHHVVLAVPPHMGQVLPLMHGLSLRPSGAFPGESLCRLAIKGTPARSKLFGSTARGRGFISSDQVGAGSSPGPI